MVDETEESLEMAHGLVPSATPFSEEMCTSEGGTARLGLLATGSRKRGSSKGSEVAVSRGRREDTLTGEYVRLPSLTLRNARAASSSAR